ncbi:MAG: response regulator [Nitrospira sp. CR1.2]|nr:response regulator [Nitrospira sp. CR1.2]
MSSSDPPDTDVSPSAGQSAVQREVDSSSGGEGPASLDTLRVVAIGASAGGLAALERFFSTLPSNPGAAFVVIQHLSPDYPSHMQELLARHTDMPVRQAQHNETLLHDHCYLIPPGKLLTQQDGRLVLEARGDLPLHQPIDHFFRSLASYGARAAAVVLTGTGSDGSRGLQTLAESGGVVFVQDPDKAEFQGMPSSALDAVRPHLVGDPSALALGVYWWLRNPETFDVSGRGGRITTYQRILAHLKNLFGIEFELYKQGTILRRLERRMGMCAVSDLELYLKLLSEDQEESKALLDDLLIGVTSFFRDTRVFEHLRAEVIPELVRTRLEQKEIRCWVPGCATGQEAYGLAMLLHEAAAAQNYQGQLRVFATDVHRSALETAGIGTYPEEELAAIPPELFERYVVRLTSKSGRVAPLLRKMVVFAPHNVLVDPAFTRLDLISCRNLLIYFDTPAQELALRTFRFCLNPEGILLLGVSEGIGSLHEDFTVVDPRLRVFRKLRGAAASYSPMVRKSSLIHTTVRQPRLRAEAVEIGESRLLSVYDSILTQCHVAGLLLDDHGRLAHVFGDGSRLLCIREGRQTDRAVKLFPDALESSATGLIHRATMAKQVCRSEPIHLTLEDKPTTLILTATPFSDRHGNTSVLLSAQPVLHASQDVALAAEGVTLPSELEDSYRQRLMDLEREVSVTRENLQTTIEELQTTNEELQSSNEELQSANEELQSANEELQSVNEELHTVNSEYDQKNRILIDLNRDHDNLLNNTDVGIIFVDRHCRIRRFNTAATVLFRLIPRDVGRELSDITSDVPDEIGVHRFVRQVIDEGMQHEQSIELSSGRCYLLRLAPYRTEDRTVEGALVTITDMTRRHQLENRLRHGQRLEAIGRLAGGIAHDFNNLLCGIQGYAQLMEQRTQDEEQLKPLRAIQEATARAATLTANLLAFGRKAKLESKPLDFHQLIRTTLELANTNWHDSIRMRMALEAPYAIVVGDSAQLQAMVLNLLINAKDAMPRGGAITISTYEHEVDQVKAAELRPPVEPGRYLVMNIADQGSGIASEYLEHLFEPFYTTKGEAGNGLGLAAVYGTVSEHGGGIQLVTGEQGTAFRIHLPLSAAGLEVTTRPPHREAAKRGSGRVLLVDDEVAIRDMVGEFLGGLGYTITTADSGPRAIAAYQHQERFDVVLLDVTMPGMNGVDVFHVLREIDPRARVLLLSGHAFGQVDQELLEQGLCGFVKKPFDLVELSHLVAGLCAN